MTKLINTNGNASSANENNQQLLSAGPDKVGKVAAHEGVDTTAHSPPALSETTDFRNPRIANPFAGT